MHVNGEIRALIDDPASLRAQQDRHAAAWSRWAGSASAAPLLADFSAFAAGTPLTALPSLAGLFSPDGAASRAVRGLVDALLPALAAAPFGQVPLRHHVGSAATTLMLAREGEASLSLVALDPAGLAKAGPAQSAAFAPAEEWDVVLAGRGFGRLVEGAGERGLLQHLVCLEPGLALGRDAVREALLVDRAETTVLLLRLRRLTAANRPVRELDLADGALLHQAEASARESRHEIAVALLGAMGRADAVPSLAEIAQDARHGAMLRWQALRQCLALDTLAGFRALAALACCPDDALAPAAGALRAQLIEQHPVLAGIEPCPA